MYVYTHVYEIYVQQWLFVLWRAYSCYIQTIAAQFIDWMDAPPVSIWCSGPGEALVSILGILVHIGS